MRTNDKYILVDKKPVEEPDLLKWGHWFETGDRTVKHTVFSSDIKVSTVFLGLNHCFGEGEPLLFETMISGGEHDGYQERYATWEDAEKGHEEAIKLINHENKNHSRNRNQCRLPGV